MAQLTIKLQPRYREIKLSCAILILLASILLLQMSCRSHDTNTRTKNDTLYVYGYFYPRERLHIVINGERVFDSTMSQIEYFELPVAFAAKTSNKVRCNLSYDGKEDVIKEFYLTDTNKTYQVIVPIGVPLGYKQLDTTKPPSFDSWKNLTPDSLYREIRLDYKGRLSNY